MNLFYKAETWINVRISIISIRVLSLYGRDNSMLGVTPISLLTLFLFSVPSFLCLQMQCSPLCPQMQCSHPLSSDAVLPLCPQMQCSHPFLRCSVPPLSSDEVLPPLSSDLVLPPLCPQVHCSHPPVFRGSAPIQNILSQLSLWRNSGVFTSLS